MFKFILKIFFPVTLVYTIYFFIVSSDNHTLFHDDFYVTYQHLLSTINERKSHDIVFIGPSTLAGAVMPLLVSESAINLSVSGSTFPENYYTLKRLVDLNLINKCVVFSLNYNRTTDFSDIDPLDNVWPLFFNNFLSISDLRSHLAIFNYIYPDNQYIHTGLFYFRLIANKLKLTNYHMLNFFSFFHGHFNKDHSIEKLKKLTFERKGYTQRSDKNLTFFSPYNFHYMTEFEQNQLLDIYFGKFIKYLKSKNIRSVFIMPPISPYDAKALSYYNRVFFRLQFISSLNDLEKNIIYHPDDFPLYNFIDFNHLSYESAILFSKNSAAEIKQLCGL